MTKKIISLAILLSAVAAVLIAGGVFFLSPVTADSELNQQSKGWRVWVKTSPCSGRFDWLAVSRDSPPSQGGLNFYVSYESVLGRAPSGLKDCFSSDSTTGCTFAEAEKLRDALRSNSKFSDYCCRDYSVWKDTQTGKLSVALVRVGTPGLGQEFVKGNLCCEEAEEIAGTPGVCKGVVKHGGWGARQEGSINEGDGKTLTYYRGTTAEQCQADCDKNPQCVAFTLIKAGAFSPSDPPMCYLASEARKITPSSCCITAIKGAADDDNNSDDSDAAEADLSGTWAAVVNDDTGRWDYIMVLSRASAGKWTGTITFTLNGKDSTTNNVSIDSTGSGKMTLTWRPGQPNAQPFSGAYSENKINMDGYGGKLLFTRR